MTIADTDDSSQILDFGASRDGVDSSRLGKRIEVDYRGNLVDAETTSPSLVEEREAMVNQPLANQFPEP